MKPVFSKAAFLVLLAGALPSAPSWADAVAESVDGREALVYAPANLPAKGARALVVVLHSGLGNAARIEGGGSEKELRMDTVAAKYGFIVAYLNGTPITRMFGADKLGWNAGGGCCGVPARNNVDDVGYIRGAVRRLVKEYGVDPARVYGLGHSSCPAAKGKRILSIHGAEDRNVPVGGGQGSVGLSHATYNSESRTQKVFVASGAEFRPQIVPGAAHSLDEIDAKIEASEGVSLAEKAARFFGLAR